MKKNISILAAGLALLLSSCYGDYMPEDMLPEAVPVTVKVSQPWTTKAKVTEGDDMKLRSFKVFVFDKDGKTESVSDEIKSGSTVTFKVLPGRKTFWVLANLKDASADKYKVQDEKALLSIVTNLSDNALDRIIMSGSKETEISSASTINVSVSHIACKVVLDQVKRDFTEKKYADIGMKIKRIYMGNVATDTNFDCSRAPSKWYNRLSKPGNDVTNDLRVLILDDNINADLPDGGVYDRTHTFYVYPNPETEDTSTTTSWHLRTRLVVECEYNGQACYYPITLPKLVNGERGVMTRNTEYHVSNLTLKRPGTDNPEYPAGEVDSYVNATFNIEVSDWNGGASYSEIYQ